MTKFRTHIYPLPNRISESLSVVYMLSMV